MPKVPKAPERSSGRDPIHKILREDAERQLKQDGLPPPIEKLYQLLLSQPDMVGTISTWMPSLDAKRKIAAISEDRLQPDGVQIWLADEVRDLILGHRADEAVKLIEKFTLPGIIEKLDKVISEKPHLIYRLGDIWLIKYQTESAGDKKPAWFTDSKALRYVIKLLDNPYHDYSPTDLKDDIAGVHNGSKIADQRMIDANLKEGYLYPNQKSRKLHSGADKKTIVAALDSVFEELKNSSADKMIENQDRWRKIKNEFKEFVSVSIKTGQPQYRWKHNPDKDRSNVTIQVNAAIQKITTTLPHLGEHLGEYIKTGGSMRYIPPEDTPRWYVRW